VSAPVLEVREYLVGHGTAGDFGRFRPTTALTFRRGDRVVVRSFRGLELGTVLCEATAGHAHFLPNTTVGKLLRVVTAEDEEKAEAMRRRGHELFAEARRVAAELAAPLEMLDAEVMLDGKQAVLHHLAWGDFDERDLVSRLSHRFDFQLVLHSLALAETAEEPEEHGHGCGRPDCGKKEGGGCSTCGSGGGCSTCGTGADLKAYFAGLREQMAAQQRTPLL
jgi:cell fate regulator YaaT (PSP1 superfamily)